jgi:hypothetical protein
MDMHLKLHFYPCKSAEIDSFDKNGLGHNLGDFHRTHLVTLIATHKFDLRNELLTSD